jgi:hypothetical protein
MYNKSFIIKYNKQKLNNHNNHGKRTYQFKKLDKLLSSCCILYYILHYTILYVALLLTATSMRCLIKFNFSYYLYSLFLHLLLMCTVYFNYVYYPTEIMDTKHLKELRYFWLVSPYFTSIILQT